MQETGIIVGSEKGYLHVATEQSSTCNACNQQQHCPSGLLAKAKSSNRQQIIKIPSTEALTVGSEVTLHSSGKGVVLASMLVYLLPLLAAVLTAVAAPSLFALMGLHSEVFTIGITFFAGFVTYKVAMRWVNQMRPPQCFAIQVKQI